MARYDHIESQLAARGIPGLALAVIHEGKPLDVKTYGQADLTQPHPLTPNAVFDIASVSKTFLATLILMLIEEHAFSLESQIADIVPDLPKAWQPIRVEHVLRHRSGIRDYCTMPAYWERCAEDTSPHDLLALVAALPLDFKPGSQWAYDNTGFYLLWMLIEAATGQAFIDVLTERLLVPLGMQHTYVNTPHLSLSEHVKGSIRHQGQTIQATPYHSSNAPYNLLSCITDLVKWATAFYHGRVVNPSTRDLMWSPQLSPVGNEQTLGFTMGLGWFIADSPVGRVAAHNGETPASFSSSLCHFLDTNLSVIILANLAAQHDLHTLAYKIADDVISELSQ